MIREALRELTDEGWFVFEAGGADVMAGQQYTGMFEGRVHEIVAHAGGTVAWVMPLSRTPSLRDSTRKRARMLDALRPFVETGQLVDRRRARAACVRASRAEATALTSLFETLRLEPLDLRGSIASGAGLA